MIAAPGIRSCSMPSRFGSISLVSKVKPVALPPGRLRLSTNPAFTEYAWETGMVIRAFVELAARSIEEKTGGLAPAASRARLAPIAAERPEIRAFADFIQASTRSIVR